MDQFRICKDCGFSGVYAIVNIDKQKIYIGSSRNIKKRLETHKSKLRNNKSNIEKMQEDFNNGNKFIAYVITPAVTSKTNYYKDNDLRHFEYIAIEEFDATNAKKGYNTRKNDIPELEEKKNIYFANVRLQGYFADSRNKGRFAEEAKKDAKEFINYVLLEEGRF